MRPIWRVVVDGVDITDRVRPSLLSLSVTDKSGNESDELELQVADPRADIEWPKHGVMVQVSMGYESSGLADMGTYTIDSVELSSPPREWSARGNAADLGAPNLKTRRTRSWESKTLGDVVWDIASANGLQAKISESLSWQQIARLDQTLESDVALLTRLGKLHDAIASVKAGYLLFAKRGQATSVSGAPMPEVEIKQTIDWRVSISDRDRYTAVEARFYDRDSAEEVWTRAGQGEGDAVFRLRRTYPDRSSAQAAADAKLGALARGNALLSLNAPGDVRIGAETPILLRGLGDGVDGRWVVTSARHSIDSAGFRTAIEGERE
jgi:uncharacterized protein